MQSWWEKHSSSIFVKHELIKILTSSCILEGLDDPCHQELHLTQGVH